jgi:hypothetical protein
MGKRAEFAKVFLPAFKLFGEPVGDLISYRRILPTL